MVRSAKTPLARTITKCGSRAALRFSSRRRTILVARRKFVDHMLAIEDSIRGLLKVHGIKLASFIERVSPAFTRPIFDLKLGTARFHPLLDRCFRVNEHGKAALGINVELLKRVAADWYTRGVNPR